MIWLLKFLYYLPVTGPTILKPNLYFIFVNVQWLGQIWLVVASWILLIFIELLQFITLLGCEVDPFFRRRFISLLVLLVLNKKKVHLKRSSTNWLQLKKRSENGVHWHDAVLRPCIHFHCWLAIKLPSILLRRNSIPCNCEGLIDAETTSIATTPLNLLA